MIAYKKVKPSGSGGFFRLFTAIDLCLLDSTPLFCRGKVLLWNILNLNLK